MNKEIKTQAKLIPESPENLSDKLVKMKAKKVELVEKVKEEMPSHNLNEIYMQNKDKYEKEFGIKSPEDFIDTVNKLVA